MELKKWKESELMKKYETQLAELSLHVEEVESLLLEDLRKADELLPDLQILDNERVVEYFMMVSVEDAKEAGKAVDTYALACLIEKIEAQSMMGGNVVDLAAQGVSMLRRLAKQKNTRELPRLTEDAYERMVITNFVNEFDMFVLNARDDQRGQGLLVDLISSVALDEHTLGNLKRSYADLYPDKASCIACYERMIAAYPDDANILYGLLLKRSEDKEYDQCRELIAKGLELQDSSTTFMYLSVAQSIAKEQGDMVYYDDLVKRYQPKDEKVTQVHVPFKKEGLPLAIEAYQDAKPNKPCPCGSGKKFKACCKKIIDKMN